jgi:hypothetical protein
VLGGHFLERLGMVCFMLVSILEGFVDFPGIIKNIVRI